jgi:hypothetical protein
VGPGGVLDLELALERALQQLVNVHRADTMGLGHGATLWDQEGPMGHIIMQALAAYEQVSGWPVGEGGGQAQGTSRPGPMGQIK